MKKICFLLIILISTQIFAEENSRSLYISTKYQMTPPYSLVGGNVEIALINRKQVFIGLDFGGGYNPITWDGEFGWGFSLGKPIKPTDWLQIIPGGSITGWIFLIVPEYGCTVGGSPAFGGPFVKMLFGRNRFFGEFSQRVLFGANFEYGGALIG